ncbi:hypothetical protein M2D07_030740 [Pseudomonas sp. BGr12]|uniref:hypothetical protein n=1 Tax=Pseudomonas sp. BGr12 TaxID=2936269 RepID=UPI00385FCF02
MSMAYVIGVGQLSYVAPTVNNRGMTHPTEVFLFVTLLYLPAYSALDLAAGLLIRLKSTP